MARSWEGGFVGLGFRYIIANWKNNKSSLKDISKRLMELDTAL